MISYHPKSDQAPVGTTFTSGFIAVDVDDPNRIANCITRFAWAPASFRNGYRNRENFLGANWLGLDFDSPEISLAEVQKSVCDMVHVLGITRNHQIPKDGVKCDRFRLLLKTERVMIGPEVVATLRHLAKIWPIDESCIDTARHFFPCREIISVSAEGFMQEIMPPAAIRPRAAPKRYRRNKMVRPRTIEALRKPFPHGAKNQHCFMVAKDLYDAGYEFNDIYAAIVNSPTYGGAVEHDLGQEISRCIENGISSVRKGKAYGGCEGSGGGEKEAEREEAGG